mgnify:CR=1 FL=1
MSGVERKIFLRIRAAVNAFRRGRQIAKLRAVVGLAGDRGDVVIAITWESGARVRLNPVRRPTVCHLNFGVRRVGVKALLGVATLLSVRAFEAGIGEQVWLLGRHKHGRRKQTQYNKYGEALFHREGAKTAEKNS